jgi:hypothetical protein
MPNVAGLLGITRLLNVTQLQRIAGLLRVAGLLNVAELQRIVLAIFQLLATLLSLADSEGLALAGLGGVNLVCLTAFSKFIPISLVLPEPIFYLLSELLSSLQCFLNFWEAFLRVFSNLSNFSLKWANDCFAGFGFLPAFLTMWKSAFTILSFLYLRQSLVACVVCAPPYFLHSLQDFSK